MSRLASPEIDTPWGRSDEPSDYSRNRSGAPRSTSAEDERLGQWRLSLSRVVRPGMAHGMSMEVR